MRDGMTSHLPLIDTCFTQACSKQTVSHEILCCGPRMAAYLFCAGQAGDGVNSGEIVERARAQHRAGDLAGAEQLYRAVLAAAPVHFGAAHMLGALFLQ